MTWLHRKGPATPDQGADTTQVHDYDEPRTIRLRLVPWDVVTMLVLLALLIVALTMTSWPTRLFAFTENICQGDDCAPVPFGVNYYIYPLMWGGFGAAGHRGVARPVRVAGEGLVHVLLADRRGRRPQSGLGARPRVDGFQRHLLALTGADYITPRLQL